MNQTQLLTKTNSLIWVKTLVIILLGLGIFFRFTHLGQKIYCGDEPWTSVAISGHTLAELREEFSQTQGTTPITAFDKYQHITPDRGLADTVNYLITSDPQHPPLYYVMVRLWAQIFGDAPTAVRSLSAIISLLIFPSVYWLCLELFDSAVVGWIAMGLIAVSPTHLYFAQEVRQYGLWMTEILVSSAVFLRAIKREKKRNWLLYSLTLILGLYTHLFTVLLIMSHGIYVIIQQQLRWTKTLINYLIGTIFACLMFVPWLIVIITHIGVLRNLVAGYGMRLIDNPFELIAVFLIRVTRIFFDLNLAVSLSILSKLNFEGSLYYTLPSLIFSCSLLIYLLFILCRNYQNKTYLFLFLLGGLPSILFIIYDLTAGGVRSIQVRYQLPLYLCLEITVAYLLSFAFEVLEEKSWRKNLAQLMIIVSILSGLVSDAKYFQAQIWWMQSASTFIQRTGQAIDRSEIPLLVINNSPINLGGILALSRYSPKVPLLMEADNDTRQIPDSYSQIFFVQNNSRLFHQMAQNKHYNLNTIMVSGKIPPGGLWQFDKNLDLVTSFVF